MQDKQNWTLSCCWVPRDEEGRVQALMSNGFLEPDDRGFIPGLCLVMCAPAPQTDGWLREGQSQRPHGWGLKGWSQAGSACLAAH